MAGSRVGIRQRAQAARVSVSGTIGLPHTHHQDADGLGRGEDGSVANGGWIVGRRWPDDVRIGGNPAST